MKILSTKIYPVIVPVTMRHAAKQICVQSSPMAEDTPRMGTWVVCGQWAPTESHVSGCWWLLFSEKPSISGDLFQDISWRFNSF